jgi:hypothetical protein
MIKRRWNKRKYTKKYWVNCDYTIVRHCNYDFTPIFFNFVILSLYLDNEPAVCPSLSTLLVKIRISDYKIKKTRGKITITI